MWPSKDSVEQENKIADENVDLDEGTTSPLNEDGGEYVESQVSTEPEIQHKSSNRRVTKELFYQKLESWNVKNVKEYLIVNQLYSTTLNPSMKVSSMLLIIVTTKQQQRVIWKYMFNLNMKVWSMLVISVTI